MCHGARCSHEEAEGDWAEWRGGCGCQPGRVLLTVAGPRSPHPLRGSPPSPAGSQAGTAAYESYLASAAAIHCILMRAITAPANAGSLGVHRWMGFQLEAGNG